MKITSYLVALCSLAVFGSFNTTAEAKKTPRNKHHRTDTKHAASSEENARAQERAAPPPIPAAVVALLNEVADAAPRNITDTFKQNPCELFEENKVVIEPARIICRNAIYHIDKDTHPLWFETDRVTGKLEQQILIDFPAQGSVITTYVPSGESGTRGIYISLMGQ